MLLTWLNRFPPYLCRLVARDGRRALTIDDLAARSGMDRSTIAKLSRRKTWPTNTRLSTIEKFTTACGVDFFRLHQHLNNLKRKRLAHTKTRPDYYRRLLTK